MAWRGRGFSGASAWARPPRTPMESLIRFGGACVGIYSSFALISHYLITYSQSEGPSMYPTLPSGLSCIIYSRRHRGGKNVKLGDVVVFESPMFLRSRSCKRIVGMPGDYIVRDSTQSPSVGGAPVPGIFQGEKIRQEPGMVQVPEGHVWVAGDNLSYSRDSRFHGPLPMALITGKALYVGDGWFSWRSLRTPQLHPITYADDDKPHEDPVNGELGPENTRPA